MCTYQRPKSTFFEFNYIVLPALNFPLPLVSSTLWVKIMTLKLHSSWESTSKKKDFFLLLSSARFACHRGEGNKKIHRALRHSRHFKQLCVCTTIGAKFSKIVQFIWEVFLLVQSTQYLILCTFSKNFSPLFVRRSEEKRFLLHPKVSNFMR